MDERELDERRTAQLLRQVFGSRLPPEQLEAWLSATPARRVETGRRLDAILRWPTLDLAGRKALAKELNRALGRLSNLASAWNRAEEKSLALLGLRIGERRITARADKEVARRKAVRAVHRAMAAINEKNGKPYSAGSAESIVEKARSYESVKAEGIGHNMLREVVREIRRDETKDLTFGAHVVFDEVPLAVCAPSRRAYRAVLVLDKQTQLVIGVGIEPGTANIRTIRRAARNAAARLHQMRLPGVSGPDPKVPARVTVALSEDNAVTLLRFFSDLPEWEEELEIRGRQALGVIGNAIGRVGFRPHLDRARGLDECNEQIPVISQREARMLLELAIRRHNAEIMGKCEGDEDPTVAARRLSLAAMLREAAQVMP